MWSFIVPINKYSLAPPSTNYTWQPHLLPTSDKDLISCYDNAPIYPSNPPTPHYSATANAYAIQIPYITM